MKYNLPKGFALLMAVLVGSSFHAPSDVLAAVGDPVPKFDLVDLAGRRHTYAEYEGQILVLFFLGHN